jgi:hypothetical protein
MVIAFILASLTIITWADVRVGSARKSLTPAERDELEEEVRILLAEW